MYKTILITFLLFSIAKVQGQDFGGWQSTDSLIVARENGASVELPNGDILISGGINLLKSCEIYDYEAEEWRLTDSLNTGQSYHILVKLMNGNILSIGNYLFNVCEIFDVTTEEWSPTDSLHFPRKSTTVTVLNNGNVLVAGGSYSLSTGESRDRRECEIYDPDSGKWTFTDSLTVGRVSATATKLLDGRVLFAGGNSYDQNREVANCNIYDPVTGRWSEAAPLNIARYHHAATLLEDGKVIVTGGTNYSDPVNPWMTSCEVYDPVNNTWTLVTPLSRFKADHAAILLDNGLLLIVGGTFNSSWELYDPVNYKNIHLEDYPGNQYEPNVNKLPNGKILTLGGYSIKGEIAVIPTKKCFVYDPTFVGITEGNNSLPVGYQLFQNYPNPFNPTTFIQYSIPRTSKVKITVYGILGNRITILLQRVQSPGTYTIKFDCTDLPSGIYLYKIETRDWTKTKKMLLIK